MRVVKEKANAKINLYLDVLAKREDGFHDIKTVMHSVSLYDTLTVSATDSSRASVRLSVSGSRFLPTDTKNLAARAAFLFLERGAISATIDITLEKRIPIAAGLAGGSSDAAAVLRAMNRLFGKMFSQRALHAMAEELGSDVSYCLSGKTALCEGRGELITPIMSELDLNLVIAIANEHVSTPMAYKTLDSIYSDFDGSVLTGGDAKFERLMVDLKNNTVTADGLFNTFEAAVLPTCSGATRLKERMTELGARGVLMSGSGPSVFGIFDTYERARGACEVLRGERYKAYYAKSI